MFTIVSNGDGTFRIEMMFTVYREKFGHHPSWLPCDEEKGKREGYPTTYWFLIEDDLTGADTGDHLIAYQKQYSKLISEIENDDTRWDEFPFKDRPITYSK
jgi:hypothetical protein